MVGKEKVSIESGVCLQYTTIKARLYPSEQQAELFEKTFDCCRYLWNQMLADQQRFYWETDVHFIPTPAKYKNGAPFLKEVDNQALIQEHNKLSQAFRVFFKNPESFGYPRFKRKKDNKNSFSACNHEFPSGPTIYTTKDGIRMTKAGIVKAKFSREPKADWALKRITVQKAKTGTFYCYLVYAYTAPMPKPIPPTEERTVGIKYSVPHFFVADDGTTADPPHWLRESQEKLAECQRKLSRMQPGSKNYQEMVQKYRELHEHIANQRRDFIHKQSSRIANDWDAVCVRADALDEVNRTMKRANLYEAGFGMFRECLKYKLARQGKQYIPVDRYYPSSRICSRCGHELPQAADYRRRTWTCPECGAVLNREVNAAQNIKEEGLRQVSSSSKSR